MAWRVSSRLNSAGLTNLRRLNLQRNELTGPIPPELASLANLWRLDLSANDLTGPIPPELANLGNLVWLDLGSNVLTGPIPAALQNLVNLEHLGLGDNDLTGPLPSWLGNLSKLRKLWAARAGRLTGPIPRELGRLVNLGWLNLSGMPLGGRIPPELGSLSSLRVLQLYRMELTGPIPTELGNLERLQNLELMVNKLTGPIPPELGNLSNLATIYAHSNRLAGPLPPELGRLSNLSNLVLANNPLLLGPLPTSFLGMESLTYLRIQETGLCIPQTTEFRMWLQGIRSAAGEDCPIIQVGDREALAAIYEWTNGDGWQNNENWLGEGPLDDWHGVTADAEDRVTALHLPDNNLSGILPLEAARLPNLEALVLNDNNELGGELHYHMLALTSLATLRLDGTGVCASAAAVFEDWLGRIDDARVMACPDDHGNDASDATGATLGDRIRGEIESHADEDWFRVELGGNGTLSVAAGG